MKDWFVPPIVTLFVLVAAIVACGLFRLLF